MTDDYLSSSRTLSKVLRYTWSESDDDFICVSIFYMKCYMKIGQSLRLFVNSSRPRSRMCLQVVKPFETCFWCRLCEPPLPVRMNSPCHCVWEVKIAEIQRKEAPSGALYRRTWPTAPTHFDESRGGLLAGETCPPRVSFRHFSTDRANTPSPT